MFDFMSGWFDEIRGLPLHPLVVHAVVVLVPISAIGMVVAMAVPRWRSPLQWYALTGLGIGAVGTYLAKISGDSLSAAVGLPTDHADLGNRMVPMSIAMFVIAAAWVALRRLNRPRMRMIAQRSLGVVGGVLAVVLVGLTYLVGNSGAQASWSETLEEARRPPAAAATVVPPIPFADVERRNTAEDCWSVVDGVVYDLTAFIARHPAGASDIEEMCGTDASEEFNGTHSGQAEPEEWLAVFRVGELERG